MYILIDQGNTKVKIAISNNEKIVEEKSIGNTDQAHIQKYLENIFDKYQLKAGIISSVTSEMPYHKTLQSKIRLIELSANLPLPVKLKYNSPETLGKDRIALVCGASALFENANILIIDAGTCITYDFLDNENVYHGGAISPGIHMRLKALNTFTSNLPLIIPETLPNLTGSSTKHSILSGVMNGTRAEIDGIIDQYKEKYPDIVVAITGGDMFYFDKYLKNNIFASANLVLTGLRNILKHNEKNL